MCKLSQTYIAYSLQQMHGLRRCIEEIIFSFTYPRLDMEVCEVLEHFLIAFFRTKFSILVV